MNRIINRTDYKENSWKILLALAVLLFLMSLTLRVATEGADKAAADLGTKIEKRLDILERHAGEILYADRNDWLEMKKLPQDMVIYKYVYDTLQSWNNQFPVSNDNISTRVAFERLSSIRAGIISPLSEIPEEATYMNLGPKWYIMKMKSDHHACRVVYGLEIQNTLLADRQNSDSGVNPELKLPKKYLVTPLSHTGGVAVTVHGKPLLKVISETTRDIPFPANMILKWIALALFALSMMAYLWRHPSVRTFPAVVLILAAAAAAAYGWGLQMRNVMTMFSPGIYAGGTVMFSFGALVIINCFVFCYLICVYLCRKPFMKMMLSTGKVRSRIIYAALVSLTVISAAVYVHASLVSLILNSNITLELYQWFNLSIYSAIVYVSYMAIFFAMLLVVLLLKPLLPGKLKKTFSITSRKLLFAFSVICSLYLTVTIGVLGFKKEENRLSLLTNRLAVDRDLSLEIQLRSIEDGIASDPMVTNLSVLPRSDMIILNRLTENYLYRISQEYSVTATICRDNENRNFGRRSRSHDEPCLDYFGKKFMSGTPVSPDSRFRFVYDEFGNSMYIGSFIYYSNKTGVVHMFLEVEKKAFREENGYMNIFGRTARPDHVNLPPFFSFAKFLSGKLVSYKGNYPYPAIITPDIIDLTDGHFRKNGYIHFVNKVSDDEIIFTSRPVRGWLTYIVNFSYLVILMYGALYLLSLRAGRLEKTTVKNYYRSRINSVLTLSLLVTLIGMTSASVAFVYKRNNTNVYNLMSEKINTLQGLMEARAKHASDWQDMNSPDIAAAMEDIGNTTKSDITLYTPGGKVFRSTAPEVFEKMILGARMSQEAYYNIKFRNQRFCICKEDIAGHKFISLYAPLFNEQGKIVAILSSPYTDQNYAFRHEAFLYSAIIINIFIILLITTILLSTTIVNAIFKPLTEIGEKMSSTDLKELKPIEYDRDDEISTLVSAYNKMATDLSESTRKLAQAERDKAWSEMARQVAHEIKNPLTPIKLEIQRLIRLKQRHDPNWDEKFDKVSSVVLEHIDILTETANEFSTFAKLYSEEPVRLDLDATLRDQLLIFDNKENINIAYLGMPDAYVTAPKPQLIRVFVNLLTNAIQAIEIQQKQTEEEGKPAAKGEILICLRNSTVDGYYDIVFEDNGPGVSEENQSRLFTPNFTTKSAGTGLGLAICRNIVEKCNGEITYRKSYNLYGACFTVRLPKGV